ncbi:MULTISPECIES: ABC transporter permease [Aerococcus]|uniref:ABC transporter permease n=1 Tax=Aerococcus viridans TaxID=1377 RepID=A0A2N6UEY9_9LACT|nr:MULTISPECIES: ABC transporter permease [Aerococcus]OFU48355.1 ABC transporter permease [Aerococcus sp. HMSC10H05]PMC80120.1 ABC transporter permease [Aerococcus viridans]
MRNSRLAIIIEEVYKKNVFSWSFVMLLLSPILMVAVVAIIATIIGSATASDSIGTVAIVGVSDQTGKAIANQDNGQNQLIFDQDTAQAEAALANEEIDGYLKVDESDPENIQADFYRSNTGKNISTDGFQNVLEDIQLSNRSESLGLLEEEASYLLDSSVPLHNQTVNLEAGTTESSQDLQSMFRTGVAYVVSFIVFMFVMNYISIISQEIAVEKGSRIMEIVLSSISSNTHFMGKMIGISLVLLTQVAFYAILLGIAFITLMRTPLPPEIQSFLGNESILTLLGSSSSVLMWSGLLAFLGIITYSVLGAFLGSLVSNVQDVNKMVTPIILLSIVGFYIGMFGLGFSNNILVRVGSQIPFFTPFVMPFRIATETVSTTELVLSVIISLLFSILCLWLSANFYRSNVLTYSDKGLFGTLKQSYNLRQNEKKS